MKKLTTIFGITILSALLIVPIAVWAHGWGAGGGHMMGYWGGGPGNMMGYGGGGPGSGHGDLDGMHATCLDRVGGGDELL